MLNLFTTSKLERHCSYVQHGRSQNCVSETYSGTDMLFSEHVILKTVYSECKKSKNIKNKIFE